MNEIEKITSYKSSKTKLKIGVVLLVLLLGVAGYIVFIQEKKDASYRYITQPLEKSDLTLTVSATGYLEPVDTIEVGTEVSGTIEEVYVDYNDQVTKGQLLAKLDKTKYQSNLYQAKASLAVAEASLQQMQAQFYQAEAIIKRNQSLRENTNGALPSQNDWDRDWASYLSAKAQIVTAKAKIDQAQQTVVSSKYDLARTMVYSPIDGIILIRKIDPGQTVAASFQTPVLFKIAKDLTKMELQASVDEADISKVKEGQSATFGVDAYPKEKFQAKIKLIRVNSEILNGVVTYKAQMEVDNSALLLKPGMSADADIVTQTLTSTFIVPKAALLYIPISEDTHPKGWTDKDKVSIEQKQHIWVLENAKPRKIYVQVLGSNGTKTALASKELRENMTLIVTQEKGK